MCDATVCTIGDVTYLYESRRLVNHKERNDNPAELVLCMGIPYCRAADAALLLCLSFTH